MDDFGSGIDLPSAGSEKWWIFIVTSFAIYTIGFSLSSLAYLIHWLWCKLHEWERESDKRKTKPLVSNKKSKYLLLQEFVRILVSGDTVASKLVLVVTFICNVIYSALTIYRTYFPVEMAFVLSQSVNFIIEVTVVLILILYSLLRFLASENIIRFWLQPYTIVDVFTLPHIFVSIVLGVDYLGLRTLRFFFFKQVVLLVRMVPCIHSQDLIDVFSLFINFIILWLTSSGIIHLLEAQGDPWRMFSNSQDVTFLEFTYFMMVTMSTVGYGDYNATTDWGRFVMVFLIILGLAFFATILPALADITSSYYQRTQFSRFDNTRVPQHVIVCGHVTAFSATEFLKDFLHPDRGDTNTHVLFLHPIRPDLHLKNVVRSYYTRVQYLVGSVLNGTDLEKAKIEKSLACFILADKHCENPIEEDNANLLRLVSVKNTTTEIPVIIQLLHSASKNQVENIDGWNEGHDIALCLNELKLGLLAQSCMCPGFSTLVANLFYTSDFPKLKFFELNAWKKHYIKGASNEIYCCTFSRTFEGKPFHRVARICYNKLGLVLLALEVKDGNTCKFYINPSPHKYPHLLIDLKMHGYFIGQDQSHVETVRRYCRTCHKDVQFSHHDDEVRKFINKITARKCNCDSDVYELVEFTPLSLTHRNHLAQSFDSDLSDLSSENEFEAIKQVFGIYVREPTALNEVILNPEGESENISSSYFTPKPTISNHVVLCVFANESSPLLGLHNFIIPLRNKNLSPDSMMPVVIVSNKTFLQREWKFIQTLPEIYLVIGNPLRWKTLEEANIANCNVCVILTMLSNSNGHEQAINDKEAVLCSLAIQKRLKDQERKILIITDVRQESNVQFLDFTDEDEPDERIYKAQPFACGEAFSVSMFDSVTSSAFHSPGTLRLVEELINASGRSTKCQVVAMSLVNIEEKKQTFQQFYNEQLNKNAICLGIYRLLPNGNGDKHYVITTPIPTLMLKNTDVAFMLVDDSALTPVHRV